MFLQVPIESDADAGFAARSKRPHRRMSTQDISTSSPLRRRKLYSRGGTPGAPPPPAAMGAATGTTLASIPQSHPQTPIQQPQRHFSRSSTSAAEQDKSYATSLGDTLRHVRSSSLSAFSSPFRKTVDMEPSRKRSQRSITRWFGAGSESSSEEDDDAPRPLGYGPGSGSGSGSRSGSGGSDTDTESESGREHAMEFLDPDTDGEVDAPAGDDSSPQQDTAVGQ